MAQGPEPTSAFPSAGVFPQPGAHTWLSLVFSPGFRLGELRMAPGIPHQLMADAALVEELAEVAKDAALLHGVQMRTQESPNSSEVTAE